MSRATLINLTLIIVALLFFSFSYGKLRKTTLDLFNNPVGYFTSRFKRLLFKN
jgi:hypothetical protein